MIWLRSQSTRILQRSATLPDSMTRIIFWFFFSHLLAALAWLTPRPSGGLSILHKSMHFCLWRLPNYNFDFRNQKLWRRKEVVQKGLSFVRLISYLLLSLENQCDPWIQVKVKHLISHSHSCRKYNDIINYSRWCSLCCFRLVN